MNKLLAGVAFVGACLSGTALAQETASCASSELAQIRDPAILATMPSNDAILQAAQGAGGISQLDQMIASMRQMHEQAVSNLAIARQQVRATETGTQSNVSVSQCLALRQRGGTANEAAHCEVLTLTDMVHFSNGYIEVLDCLKRNWRG